MNDPHVTQKSGQNLIEGSKNDHKVAPQKLAFQGEID